MVLFYLFLAVSGLSCGMQDLFVAGLFVVAQGLLSSCDAWAPEHAGSVLAARGLSCPTACGISAPQLGIKPTSPALEGGFSTTGPPGKSPTLSGLFFFSPPIYLFIYFWLCWVFIAACGLPLVVVSGVGATLRCGVRASHCGGFFCCRPRALGTRASVVVVHGLSSCGSLALEHRLSSCGARA